MFKDSEFKDSWKVETRRNKSETGSVWCFEMRLSEVVSKRPRIQWSANSYSNCRGVTEKFWRLIRINFFIEDLSVFLFLRMVV